MVNIESEGWYVQRSPTMTYKWALDESTLQFDMDVWTEMQFLDGINVIAGVALLREELYKNMNLSVTLKDDFEGNFKSIL